MRKINFVINVTKNGKEIHDPILSNPSYLIFIQKKRKQLNDISTKNTDK